MPWWLCSTALALQLITSYSTSFPNSSRFLNFSESTDFDFALDPVLFSKQGEEAFLPISHGFIGALEVPEQKVLCNI